MANRVLRHVQFTLQFILIETGIETEKTMNQTVIRNAAFRVVGLVLGFAVMYGVVYAAGVWIVPLTSGTDKAILAAINPDAYAPGFDQFFRAVTDYTNFLIALPLISWMVAYAIYQMMPRYRLYVAGFLVAEAVFMLVQGRILPEKIGVGSGLLILLSICAVIGLAAHLLYAAVFRRIIPCYKAYVTGLLGIETVVVAVLAATGRIWPNSVYLGANVLLVVSSAFFLGLTAYLFHTMSDEAMRRFARVFWLVLISIYMTDAFGTNRIKEAIARPRPFNDANKPWNESVRRIPDEYLQGRNSYPSGHVSGTFGLLTPIFWHVRSRKVRAGLIGWGCLQGLSRVYTAAHFPFDCLMGGLLGFGVGTLVFFTLWGRSTWATDKEVSETA